jgi:hypothetical protein
MPFSAVTVLPPNPPIRIFFHGLVLLHSPTNTSWLADIIRGAANHTLSIEVRMKEAGRTDQILLRHYGPLTDRDPGLKITVLKADGSPDPTPVVVSKYIPSPAFPVANPNPNGEKVKDFRWAMNLEHNTFHNGKLKVKTAKTRPGIEVTGGQSVLYTAVFRNGDIPRTQGGAAASKVMGGIGSVVGANLYLADGTMAVLDFAEFERPLKLPKPAADATHSFEIYVDNSPLFAMTDHNEMMEYYKVIEREDGDDIEANMQFKLEFPEAGEPLADTGSAKYNLDAFRGSIRIPCMPGVLDGKEEEVP